MTRFRSPTSGRVELERARGSWLPARSDAAIEEEIWDSILKDRGLGLRYQENLAVEVEDGRVRLRGHILQPHHTAILANIARRVEGVRLVTNELVADPYLQQQVIMALLQDELTSPYIFTVKSRFGWISLGGTVPSLEIAQAAECVVGWVPAVRGILSLPSVFGAAWLPADENPARRTLQPRLAAVVYQDGDGPQPVSVGLVSQVLVEPCSRLVSAVAVRLNRTEHEDQAEVERLVPITAVEAASERGVWLKEGEDARQYPRYDRRQYVLPAPNWQPPFPYQAGMLRWSVSL